METGDKLPGKLKNNAIMLCAANICLLVCAGYFHARYLLFCAGISLWIGIFRLLTAKKACLSQEEEKKRFKYYGLALLAAALALCAASVIPTFSPADLVVNTTAIAVACVLIGVQAILAVCALLLCRKQKAVWSSVLRHLDWAMLGLSLAELVSRLLLVGDSTEEWPQMVCLTGCAMGGVTLLLGSNMLLCALCGYRSTRDSLRYLKEIYNDKKRWVLIATVGKDGFMTLIKFGMSIAFRSFFLFANGLFCLCLGFARYQAVQMHGKNKKEQLKRFKTVAIILCLSGLFYIAYSFRLFYGGSSSNYTEIVGIAIALYTFVMFFIQGRELIRLRKNIDIDAEALKRISFSCVLVNFVLTQTALMSFSEISEHHVSDGLAGVVFGGLVVLVGFVMLLRYRTHKRRAGYC